MDEQEKPYQGAILEPRPPQEVEKDWNIKEAVASAAQVDWKEIAPKDIRKFGDQNQDGQLSCVANTRRKLRRITFKVNKNLDVDFSSLHMYRRRFNYPDGGMAAMDCISIDRKIGMTLAPLMPSDGFNESYANGVKIEPYMDEVAAIFKTENELTFDSRDLETVASTIQKTRKGAMIWLYFRDDEYSKEVPEVKYPNLDIYAGSTSRHSVAAVEPAIYKGKKGLWVDDSAHFGGLARRFITEDFYKARNFWASYPISMKYGEAKEVTDPSAPRHTFTKVLEFSNVFSTDPDIVALQNILKHEGLFPLNIDSTGYYGNITRTAVKKFQYKHNVAPAAELEQVDGKRVGGKTIAKLNELYGR